MKIIKILFISLTVSSFLSTVGATEQPQAPVYDYVKALKETAYRRMRRPSNSDLTTNLSSSANSTALVPARPNQNNSLVALFSGHQTQTNLSYLDLAELINFMQCCNVSKEAVQKFLMNPPALWCQGLFAAPAGKLLTRFKDQNNIQMIQTIVLNPKLLLRANLINDLLKWAAGNGHQTILEFLISNEIIRPFINADGVRSTLEFAAESGQQAIIEFLINHEITRSLVDHYDVNSALRYAALNGHQDIVELLTNHEITQPLINNGASSALRLAAHNGHQAIVAFLLSNEITQPLINADDVNLAWTLQLATRQGHQAIVNLLEAYKNRK